MSDELPPDPFLGPMPGLEMAMRDVRLIIANDHGAWLLNVPLMQATARAQEADGVLLTYEYWAPCHHDEDEPCDCSPDPRQAALRLEIFPEPIGLPLPLNVPLDERRWHSVNHPWAGLHAFSIYCGVCRSRIPPFLVGREVVFDPHNHETPDATMNLTCAGCHKHWKD